MSDLLHQRLWAHSGMKEGRILKRNMNNYFLSVILFFVYIVSHGQDIEFAKKNISALCSKEFCGRGYTHKGSDKAAKYILNTIIKSDSLKKIILSSQNFEMPVCVISKLKNVKIDSKTLSPGLDFVIHPNSKKCSGTFNLFWVNKDNFNKILTNDLTQTFLVIDTAFSNEKTYKEIIDGLRFTNPFHAKGIIYLVKNEIMQIQRDEPVEWVSMEAKSSAFPLNSKQILLSFSSKFIPAYKTQNILATIPGEVDSSVVFTAHYDHLGELGTAYFPGANDNASGVAMLLDLCKTFSKQKPHYTLNFVFMTGEEVGLVGSSYFAEHPLFPLDKIKFLLNLDVIGSGEDGITVVNGSVFTKEFEQINSINAEKNYVPVVKIRGATNNSDHAPFYNKGVKSFFIYAQGKTGPYHNPNDTPENLSLGKYENIVKLLVDFTNHL